MPFHFVWVFVVVCFNLSVFLPALIYAFILSSYHNGVRYSVFTSVFDFYVQLFKSWTLFWFTVQGEFPAHGIHEGPSEAGRLQGDPTPPAHKAGAHAGAVVMGPEPARVSLGCTSLSVGKSAHP